MGFSIRVAPGVRIRASSRGVRTSIGPRVARVHLGAGAPGISTGVGPIGYYTSLGAASGRGGGGGARAATAALMTAAQADKLTRGYAISQALLAITKLHEEEFEVAQWPMAPTPTPVDSQAARARQVEAALKGIGIFKRAARRAATADAEMRAEAFVADEIARRQAAYVQEQARLDEAWTAILSNEPDAVMTQLASAFEDNAAPAAPLSVLDDEASITVLIPDESSIPDQMPGYTAAGNLSIRKMTKKDHDELYALLVCGYILATVKEAFAVSPSLASVRIVGVRSTGKSAYGMRRGEAIAAASIERRALSGVHWNSVDARTILQDVSAELLLVEKGATRALQPLNLAAEPWLADLLQVIDFDELGEPS